MNRTLRCGESEINQKRYHYHNPSSYVFTDDSCRGLLSLIGTFSSNTQKERKMDNRNRTIQFKCGKIIILLVLSVITSLIIGCAALQEAQQKREKRMQEKRNEKQFLLSASKATINANPNPIDNKPHGESDHYTLKFAEDLLALDNFDEAPEREIFANSALVYMESLYDSMHDIFGFKPKHKIHVTLYDLFRGSNMHATTRIQYRYGNNIKFVTGIEMHFPIALYEMHEVRVHELTHAFTNIYFLPTWFSEGIAVLMQREYAKGEMFTKFSDLELHLKKDLNGINELENWGGHGEIGPLTQWRYSYAYSVVSQLREKHGNQLYIETFKLMEKDQLHQKLIGAMPTSFLVYYFSQAAGTDLVPFFENLKFNVRKLEKSEILEYIKQLNTQNMRGN